MKINTNLGMYSNEITFIYVVAGNDSHYDNLSTSINSVKKIYPEAKILIGDFDNKLTEKKYENSKIIDLSYVNIDKTKIFKHIIWQYKYFVAQKTDTKYNLYLDTDTVLANNLDNLIEDSKGKFLIAKHFWVENVNKFKNKVESQDETIAYIEKLGLENSMDFCAAGVFFFEKNENNLKILKDTFDLHNEIYDNIPYIKGIYDEPILNSILQKNLENVIYYNGALNHCSMIEMPIKLENNILYGKNIFDHEFKKITCLHCDKSRRDPTIGYNNDIKLIIKNLFKI
jgi:hypothetical protein